MHWASTVSRLESLEGAVDDAAAAITRDLGADRPDLVVAFVSPHYAGRFDEFPALIAKRFGAAALIGCSAGGVIGGGREVEHERALSLTAAHLPGVEVRPFDTGSPVELERPEAPATVILLADPFTSDVNALIGSFDRLGHVQTVGGLASGGAHPGANALFCDGVTHRQGAVGVVMSGNIVVDTVIAQGCRPIGLPMLVTRCDGNVIHELDQKPPIQVLQQLVEAASPRDRDLFRRSLFIGIEMRDAQVEKKAGDYLIRNIAGIDSESGAIAVAADIHKWQAVQFHLRDARTSAEDLDAMLADYRDRDATMDARGALLFSCLGRGMGLYGEPDHDSTVFRRRMGDIAIGGFFCNGEIGPVGGTTFLHGYTSAFGIFRPARPLDKTSARS